MSEESEINVLKSPRIVIDPTEAIQVAGEIIIQMGIANWSQCAILKNPSIVPQAAHLVQDDSEPERLQSYIVTYGIKSEFDEFGLPMCRICLMLNATDKTFEEVTTFVHPVSYLPREAAIDIVASALRVSPTQLDGVAASLVFEPCEFTHVRARPFWEIVFEGNTYYVDQKRRLHYELSKGKGGS